MDPNVVIPQGETLSKIVTVVGEDAEALERRLQATLDAVPPLAGWNVIGVQAAGAGAGGKWLATVTLEQSASLPPFAAQRSIVQAEYFAPIDGQIGVPAGPSQIVIATLPPLNQVPGGVLRVEATADVALGLGNAGSVLLFADGAPVAPPKIASIAGGGLAPDKISFVFQDAPLVPGPYSYTLVLDTNLAAPAFVALENVAIRGEALSAPVTPPAVIAVPGARVWAVEGAGDVEVRPQPAGALLPTLNGLGPTLQRRIQATIPLFATAHVNVRSAGANAGHRFVELAVGVVVVGIG